MQRCNGIRLYLVRLGNCCLSTSQICNKKLKSPAKLFSRIKYKFVGLQLTNMSHKSGKWEIILDLPYNDDNFAALVVEINVDENGEALNKKAPYFTDDRKCVNSKDLYGLGIDANTFPLMNYFGIPVENLQTLQVIFYELKQLL